MDVGRDGNGIWPEGVENVATEARDVAINRSTNPAAAAARYGGGGGGVPWPGHQSEPSFFPLPFSPFVCVRPVRCG